MKMTRRQKTLNLLKLFKVDGAPASDKLTEGQLEIFEDIVFRVYPFVEVITCTQYGKSLTLALAALILSCVIGKMVAIVAPTDAKAKLIMRYYVEHLGDDIMFYSQLEKNTKLERLRQEESKDRIILRNGGGVYCISAQAGNAQKSIEAAMGEGADVILEDESGLIPDRTEATIFRMIAGKKDPLYVKIGNPFYRNHFYKTSFDDIQALAEGRYTQQFIDEAKKRPLFDVLYECKFPMEDEVDERGWRRMFFEKQMQEIMIKDIVPAGTLRLGVDIGRGGNYSAYVLRGDNCAIILEKNRDPDLMSQPGRIINYMKEYKIEANNIYVDDVGVGGGVTDRLRELGHEVNGVKEGQGATDGASYANLKAENYFLVKDWIENQSGKLSDSADWYQLLEIRFKPNSSSKFQIEPKDELQKRGVESPDIADALMLTFTDGGQTFTADDFAII